MRIPSGVTDAYCYFVGVDSTDFSTRETGLSSFTVYRSRNGGAAAAMTTPTINETDATNMPGVYELLLDEDMTIGSGNDSEEIAFHITATGMAPVTRTIELYRSKITAGYTLGVESDGDLTKVNLCATTTTNTDMRGTDDAALATALATVDTNVDAILVDTGTTIPADIAGLNDISEAEVNAQVDIALSDYDGPTKAEMDSGFSGLNDVAATDIVSAGAITTLAGAVVNVDLVDTCTTNTDMVGTDGANTVAPDNAGIAANGVAIAALNDFDHAVDVVARVTLTDTTTTNSDMRGTDDAALATALATVDTSVDAILVDTGTTIPGQLDDMSGATFSSATDSLEAIRDRGDSAWITGGGGSLTVQDIVDGVWDETLADHLDSGSTGAGLNAAGSAGDPWATALPGAYGSGTAGKIVGDNINAPLDTIDTNLDAVLVDTGTTIPADIAGLNDFDPANDTVARVTLTDTTTTNTDMRGTDSAATAANLATVDTNVDAILVDTGTTIPADIAGLNDLSSGDVTAAVPTAIENADAMLNRDMDAVTDSNARTPLNALRFLRNKYSISGSTLTVTKEDDTTAAWTAALTTDPAADPVTGSDPA